MDSQIFVTLRNSSVTLQQSSLNCVFTSIQPLRNSGTDCKMTSWPKPPCPPIHVYDQVKPKYRNRFPFRAGLVGSCINFRAIGSLSMEHTSSGNRVAVMYPHTDPFEPIPGQVEWIDRNELEISDRSFHPGNWVTKDGNVGQVQRVSVRTDLHVVGTTAVVTNVPAERLIPIEKFPEGSPILYDLWCGNVVKSNRMVTVKIGTDDEEDPYVGVINSRFAGNIFISNFQRECPAFRSLKIKGPWHSLKDADWEKVKSGKKSSMSLTEFEGRVSDVEVDFLEVKWSMNIGNKDRAEPPTKLTADLFGSIDLVDTPNYSSFRLGNVRYFEISEKDELTYLNTWFGQGSNSRPDKNDYLGKKIGVQCLQTCTRVDVLWKDGSSGTFKGPELEPYTATMADFIRGDVVTGPRVNLGIVQSAMHKLKKVEVKEFETGIQITETPSGLKILEGFHLYPQNIVFRSREDVQGFICGWVVQCQNDGQIKVRCHGTGEIKLLPINDLVHVFQDPRHFEPVPLVHSFLKLERPSPQYVGTNNFAGPSTSGPAPKKNALLPDRLVIKCIDPDYHFFKNETNVCTGNSDFRSVIGQEIKRMGKELLDGIFVIGYELRMDLFSLILVGSPKTPFEGQLLFFDMSLPSGFPADPPRLYYKSFANIQILGKVVDQKQPFCIHELIGETWDPTQNYGLVDILNFLKEIVFVPEPFYNTGGIDRQKMKGCSKGTVSSRKFNERLIYAFVMGTQKMLENRSELGDWEPELLQILNYYIPRMVDRVEGWADGGHCEFLLQCIHPGSKDKIKTQLAAVSKKLKEITREESI